MSIDPSILVWMILNFLVLMLLLNRFLFKPVLSFLDARDEKIEAGRQAREEARALIHESKDHISRDLAKAKADILSQTEEATSALAEKIAGAEADAEKALSEHRQQTATALYEQEEKLAKSAEEHMDDYIAILQNKLNAAASAVPEKKNGSEQKEAFLALLRKGAQKGALKEGRAE